MATQDTRLVRLFYGFHVSVEFLIGRTNANTNFESIVRTRAYEFLCAISCLRGFSFGLLGELFINVMW